MFSFCSSPFLYPYIWNSSFNFKQKPLEPFVPAAFQIMSMEISRLFLISVFFVLAFQVTSMEISQLFSWGLFVCLSCFDDDHDDDHNRACCNGVDTKLLDSLVAWVDDRPYHITTITSWVQFPLEVMKKNRTNHYMHWWKCLNNWQWICSFVPFTKERRAGKGLEYLEEIPLPNL